MELRIDPLTGQRTLVAAGGDPTAATLAEPRPSDPTAATLAEPRPSDPTAATLAEPRPSDPTAATVAEPRPRPDAWSRFASAAGPLLAPDAPTPAVHANRELFWSGPARGVHEVLSPEPATGERLGALGAEALDTAMEHWRQRMRDHSEAACLHLAVTEDGSPVGSRAELYALEFVPAAIARERERFGAYATQTMGGNLLGDLVQHEVRERERVVAIDEEAVLLSPFAARVPYQLMIAPRTSRPHFQSEGPIAAAMLHDALGRLARRLGTSPPLNLWVRTAPRGAEEFCWRIDILPRLTPLGGLELGTGLNVNHVSPELAAAELRNR